MSPGVTLPVNEAPPWGDRHPIDNENSSATRKPEGHAVSGRSAPRLASWLLLLEGRTVLSLHSGDETLLILGCDGARSERRPYEPGDEIPGITGVLLAIAPVAGLSRVVAAAPDLAIALGYDVEAALEAIDDT